MQLELTETPNQAPPISPPSFSTATSQYGLPRSHTTFHDDPAQQRSQSRGSSPSSVGPSRRGSAGLVDPDQLDERLRRLSVGDGQLEPERPSVAGQRIRDYENAATPTSPRSSSRHVLGFQVMTGFSSPSTGVQLTDFPNGQFSVSSFFFLICLLPSPALAGIYPFGIS